MEKQSNYGQKAANVCKNTILLDSGYFLRQTPAITTNLR
jgi:hypothetical protein